ncbi:TPA_asm: matrix protein [finepatterned puffer bornavirus]|uniref:Matrix protein n=1 Tax=finepatterned puffer bornavirus TaxID=3055758 RepID=A0AA48SFL6_9MONO|nr:TPA_asm: matrix protein [finepatterned puffer bornavirus]
MTTIMPLKDYPLVDGKDSLVPGYWTLVLQIKFNNSNQFININLASTTAPFHTARLTAVLQIDIEPLDIEQVQIFYKWDTGAYASLKSLLVHPKDFPTRGRISLGPEASQHAIRGGYNVETYTIVSYGPGPLATEITKK